MQPEFSAPASKKKALLQVLPSLDSGGVERGTVDIAIAVQRTGRPSIVASAGGKLVTQLEKEGVIHISLPLASKNPLTIWRNKARLQEVMQYYDVGIVHARSRAPAWSAKWAAKAENIPFITTFHGVYGCKPFPKKWYNGVMAAGKPVIAVSRFVAEHVRNVYHVPEARIQCIPRGVDLALFQPEAVSEERVKALREAWRLTENWPVVLLPGRFTRWKGQDFFLRALTRIGEEIPFYAVMVGNMQKHPNYVQELRDFVMGSNLQKKVRLVDAVQDMPAAYKLAQIVVSASQEPEAFGRVAIEAQAMGKPVIATDIGGSRETVIHGDTGRLVGLYSTDEMAEGIQRGLTMSPTDRLERAEICRAHVKEHFSLEAMVQRTLAVYDKVAPD